jgi:hypothetical protein
MAVKPFSASASAASAAAGRRHDSESKTAIVRAPAAPAGRVMAVDMGKTSTGRAKRLDGRTPANLAAVRQWCKGRTAVDNLADDW